MIVAAMLQVRDMKKESPYVWKALIVLKNSQLAA